MLTQCDRCAAVFRVHPAQLRQAQGFVRCGSCQQVFYAVDRLLEEREPAVVPESPESNAGAAIAARRAVTPAADDLPPLRRDAADLDAEDEPRIAVPRSGAAVPVPRLPPPELLLEREGPGLSIADPESSRAPEDYAPDAHEQPASVRIDSDETDADEPEELQRDLAALRGAHPLRRGWRLFWVTSALLLSLVLTGQMAWHRREPLLTRFPDWRAPVERWCATLGCQVDTEANAPEIELLARDVRDHPKLPEALLANITMISRASSVRRYPTIEMSLFDRTGHIIGTRRFAPEEYLDPSIDVDAGMQPSRPVFVVLELAGTHSDAEGFEFDFR